jgi:cysteine desulfurase
MVPGAVVNGLGGPRLPNTLSFSFEGVDGHELVIALDLRGFAVSSGSACASGLREPSPVIRALHPDAPWRAKSALRVSIGPDTTEAALADFSHALADSVAALRADSSLARQI